jgi:predicted ATPase
MKRFILTGAPGAGKTAIIRQLEIDGFSVIDEAATDVIALGQARGVAEPWTEPSFIDSIANLQRVRLLRASNEPSDLQFHDRSAVCTAALAVCLGYPVSAMLSRELGRIKADALFEKSVFFIRNLGQTVKTEARRISFEEALHFERITRRPTVTSALAWSSSNQRPCQTGWLRSKPHSKPYTSGPDEHRIHDSKRFAENNAGWMVMNFIQLNRSYASA